MNKRLQMLEKLIAAGPADSFAYYGLAMEYRKEGRADDALRAFHELRARDPNYLPMYLMAGQLLIETGQLTFAREWLSSGIELARSRGDGKTLSELETELGNATASI